MGNDGKYVVGGGEQGNVLVMVLVLYRMGVLLLTSDSHLVERKT